MSKKITILVVAGLLSTAAMAMKHTSDEIHFNIRNDSPYLIKTRKDVRKEIKPHSLEPFLLKNTDEYWGLDIYSYDSPEGNFIGFCQVDVDFNKQPVALNVYSLDEYGFFTCKKGSDNEVVISSLN